MKLCPVCGNEYPDEAKFCPNDGGTLRASATSGDLVGQVIADRYHVIRKLGEGGMGQVYLAEHVMMGRKSAIKVMAAGMSSDPESVSRFNREASNAARINHPNVCAIYDFGPTESGQLYLAMEYLEGKSLSQLLRESGPLPLPRAADILSQCAEGLQAAHDLGIIHRDLKPDNIMVVQLRGREMVKVVDFGIAKALGGGEGQKVTKTGLVVGTPEYMSPEQLSGDTLDAHSDLYSLALVFYRMVTGSLPFQADTAQETMIKRLTEDPMPLTQARPGARFPAEFQQIMDRALSRWPKDRYASVIDFSHAVTYALGAAPDMVVEAATPEGATQVLGGDRTALVDTIPRTRVAEPGEAPARRAPTPPRAPAPERAPDPAASAGPRTGVGRATARRKTRLAVPATVVGLVAVLAAGGYAFRDRLFAPADPAAAPDSLVAQADTGPAGATPAASGTDRQGAGNVPTRSDGSTELLSRRVDADGGGGQTGQPAPVVTPPRPPAGGGGQPVVLPSVDELYDPSTQEQARRKAEAIYQRTDVTDSLRAAAAASVAAVYLETKQYGQARTWADRATALRPEHQPYRRLRDMIPATP